MDAFVISAEESLIAALRSALGFAGFERSAEMRSASWDAVPAQLAESRTGSTTLVFVHLTRFDDAEIRRLRDLLAAAQNKVHVVGIGTPRNPRLILELLRNGLFDFFEYDTPEELNLNVRGLLQRISSRRSEASPAAKIVAVIGASGGSGASTIACNIASAIANPNRSCILIDMDIGGGVLAMLLNASPRYTIASLAGKSEQLDSSLFDRALLKQESNIHLLAAPEQFGEARAITRDLLHKVIQLAQQAAPWVIVDVPSADLAEQIRLLPLCERILLPLRPDYVSLQRTKRSLDFLLRAKVPVDRIEVVLNRAGQPRELPLSCLEKALGIRIEHRLADDPLAANSAYNLGIPLVVHEPLAPLAKQLTRLGRRLVGDPVTESKDPLLEAWRGRLGRWSQSVLRAAAK